MSEFTELISFFNSVTKSFPEPNFFLEQYLTPINILQFYFELFPTTNSKVILDLGVGTGILSFMALQRGAEKVIGIDIDNRALKVVRNTSNLLNITKFNLINSSVEFFNFSKFKNKINGVIMNPPFGTKRKYLDFVFLRKAMSINSWILTLHKDNIESNKKLLSLCKENNFSIFNEIKLIYSLPNVYKVHTHNLYNVNVILYLLIPNI